MALYSRSILKGYSGPTRKLLETQLHIVPKHNNSIRRRLTMQSQKVSSGGRFAAFKRRLEGKGYSGDSGANEKGKELTDDNKKKNRMSALSRRKFKAEEKTEGE